MILTRLYVIHETCPQHFIRMCRISVGICKHLELTVTQIVFSDGTETHVTQTPAELTLSDRTTTKWIEILKVFNHLKNKELSHLAFIN